MTTFREHLEDQMKDPAFRRAWEETELGHQVARALIKLRLEARQKGGRAAVGHSQAGEREAPAVPAVA